MNFSDRLIMGRYFVLHTLDVLRGRGGQIIDVDREFVPQGPQGPAVDIAGARYPLPDIAVYMRGRFFWLEVKKRLPVFRNQRGRYLLALSRARFDRYAGFAIQQAAPVWILFYCVSHDAMRAPAASRASAAIKRGAYAANVATLRPAGEGIERGEPVLYFDLLDMRDVTGIFGEGYKPPLLH